MQLYGKSSNALVKEWAPVLDKYGVKCEMKRAQIAPLLAGICEGKTAEEVLSGLIEVEKANKNKTAQQLAETNVSGDVAQWQSVVIPMITRAFPGVIGPEIFGFQPTSTPSALIFYMTRHYTNDTANPAKPATSKIFTVADGTQFAVGGDITGATGGAGKVRHIEGNNLLISDVSGTFTNGDNLDNANPYAASATTLATQYDTEMAKKIVFSNYNDYSTTALAESATTNMKEVELRIQSISQNVTDHQIKVKWTRQMEYDLRKLHGKDAEAILSNAAAQEFALSLNQKMLSLLKTSAAAGGNTDFDYTAADGRWELEKYQNLLAVINRVSASLLVDNHIGAGNFLVMDPIMFASLDTMGLVDKSMLPGGMADPMINPFSGILMGRYRVYQDIFQTGTSGASGDRKIYVGFKDFSGNPEAEMKAGYFLSVYKAIDSIKMIGEENGHPRKIFESRYALVANPFGAENFYRVISVKKLPA